MIDAHFFRTFYYREKRNTMAAGFNIFIVSAAALVFMTASFVYKDPVFNIFSFVLLFYSFYTLGKAWGVSAAVLCAGINIALIFKTGGWPVFSFALIAAGVIAAAVYLAREMENITAYESGQGIRMEELEKETYESNEKLKKLQSVININKNRIINYRLLNDVAQKLTSTLDKKEIAAVIHGAVKKMIGEKEVDFVLLVKEDGGGGIFRPVSEGPEDDNEGQGPIKLYRRDPFDEWLIKNKHTLVIKNIDNDFRFKILRKDWIKFKSIIAIPLLHNRDIIGILKFTSAGADTFDNEYARLLNYLGDVCATAVQNSILYQQTRELATRDGLTGLYTRKYFVERMDEEIRRSKQFDEPFSFLMLDIDHFKDCNDTYGHQFGDKVLKVLGEFLKDELRDVDIIGRYGGEEFAVMLPNTAVNGARFVAERLRQKFEDFMINIDENKAIKLTLSIGGVEFDGKSRLMKIIDQADKSLYYSKENGRNKVTFYEEIKG
ncbi:MAG: GGDEF domain-containing protein [Candidatus Goldiibacteriota bacterium]